VSEATHTPTPWLFQKKTTISRDSPPRVHYRIYKDGGVYGHPASCDREEDAACIVRACNSFDALVAALKALADYVEVALGESPSTVKARAALAAARKEDA
jgi:hypothetical protein